MDLAWKNGKLSEAVLPSAAGNRCKVRYAGKMVELKMSRDESLHLRPALTSHYATSLNRAGSLAGFSGRNGKAVP